MTETKIDYESLAQDALRGVVRTVLSRVAQSEHLPGNHHFYISFNTNAEGVGISKRLREQYPDEMTVVLQHRYWDLLVHDDRFEVKLTFNSIPERLVVPFAAIKVFFDPSVPYGLQFESAGQPSVETLTIEPVTPVDLTPKRGSAKRPAKPLAKRDASPPTLLRAPTRDAAREAHPPRALPPKEPAKPTLSDVAGRPEAGAQGLPLQGEAGAEASGEPGSKTPGQVVRLDAFRKK